MPKGQGEEGRCLEECTKMVPDFKQQCNLLGKSTLNENNALWHHILEDKSQFNHHSNWDQITIKKKDAFFSKIVLSQKRNTGT